MARPPVRRASTRTLAPVTHEDNNAYVVVGATLDAESNGLVAAEGSRVRLTPTESRIRQLLLAHKGQVLSAERIWGYNSASGVAVVRTHFRHLREKIEQLPGGPRPLCTLPGVGYMFVSSRGGDDEDDKEVRGQGRVLT